MRRTNVVLIVLTLLGLLLVGSCWVVPRLIFFGLFGDAYREIRRKEAELSSDAVAQAAGRDLAQLCQTCRQHPEWFSDEPSLSPAWTPQSVLRFSPTWVEVSPEGARVEFGGGFHHFGYWMELESPPIENDPSTGWILNFYSEDSQDRELVRFTLTPDDGLTHEAFVERTLSELDRRIATGHDLRIGGSDDAFASVQRCKFAIKHNQLARLHQSIRETARQNPDAWRDVLLAYVIDVPSDPEGAAARLRQWADSKGDFSAWLMAAYAFDKVGEIEAAEETVQRACEFPPNDPPWASMHARARGYSMCRRLQAKGAYVTCGTLCERLLTYRGAGDNMASSIRAILETCQRAQSAKGPEAPPAVNSGAANEFDPFAGIDINVLRKSD